MNTIDRFVIGEMAEARTPFFGDYSCWMIGESGQYGNFVTGLDPMAREFRGTGCGRAHLWREVLGDIEDLQAILVITKFEGDFVAQCAGAVGAAAGVAFPAIGNCKEFLFSGEAVHDA